MTLYTLETIHVFQDELLREAEAQRLVNEALAERREPSKLWQWLRGARPEEATEEDATDEALKPTFSAN
jgi:hypothetical protein